MIIKIGKELFFAATIGIIWGLVFLTIIVIFSGDNSSTIQNSTINESVEINYPNIKNRDKLDFVVLKLFGLNIDSFEEQQDTDLLNLLESYQVKLVAQSKIAGEISTLLEVTTSKESKRLSVKEGDIINGLLVKSISEHHIVVEKQDKEYTIKLFHPKELN